MKQMIQALGLAWIVMWLIGCSTAPSSEDRGVRTLQGDRTGNVYVERDGVVQNLKTGELGSRRGAWIQDAQTGKLIFTYDDFIEEKH